MSRAFIILYIMAVISAVGSLAGIVMIVFGLVNKNKKTVTHGTIIAGIAMILIITGLFFGARRCLRICQKHCFKKEIRCMDTTMEMGQCKMHMMCDSTMQMSEGDSGAVTIEKKCMMQGDKPCDPSKCDPSKCPHKKQQ